MAIKREREVTKMGQCYHTLINDWNNENTSLKDEIAAAVRGKTAATKIQKQKFQKWEGEGEQRYLEEGDGVMAAVVALHRRTAAGSDRRQPMDGG